MKVFFSAIVECGSCKGTGLYVGMAEMGGAAVVCHNCKGEGFREVKHEYNQFSGRKDHLKAKRVYKTAAGYGISAEKVETEDGRVINYQNGGCTYEEWKSGVLPLPIYDLHCPLEHYGQRTEIGEALKDDGPCAKHLCIGRYIPECSRERRAECWKFLGEG